MSSRFVRFSCLSIILFLFSASLAFGQVVFTYNNFTAPTGANAPANLQANGDAGSVGAVMRLTTTAAGQSGSVWYYGGAATNPTAVSLLNGFTTSFQFQISGSPAPADGFAFVIQNGSFVQYQQNVCPNQNASSGISALETPDAGCGGDIGYTGLTKSVAIEFDDFKNAWDLDANHVAVESCGTSANTSDHTVAACLFARTNTLANPALHTILADGKPHTVVIKYTPPSCGPNCQNPNNLQVSLDGSQVLAVTFDLGTLGLDANDDAFLGFVGRTGALDANQDILSWNFSTTTTLPPQSANQGSTVIATFNAAAGNLVQEVVDLTSANVVSAPNTQMQVTDQAILFSAWQPTWVPGTPFATSSCWQHTGEGSNCKLYIDLCTNNNSGTPAGVNCPTSNPPSIIVTDNFDGPKIPPDSLPPNTGFGLLEAPDNWQGGPCVFPPPNTAQPCPTNVLTSLTGDPSPSGTVPHFNSTFVAVYGVPQPGTTIALNPPANGNGWINNNSIAGPSVSATFTTSTQPAPSPNPNNYVQPNVAQLTYSFAANPPGAPVNSIPLLAPTSPAVPSFTFPVQNLGSLQDGRYLLNYQGQDDHGTRELVFTLTNNIYSTSGKSLPVNIDTTKPTESISLVSSNVFLNLPDTANYTCSDALSGVATCGAQAYAPAVLTTPNVAVPLSTATPGSHVFSVTATDAAGNTSTTSVNYNVTYQFFGFVPEVFFPGINKVKAGITIPAGFLLTDGNFKAITNLTSITVTGFASTNCSGQNPTPVAISGNLLNFGYGIYDYNWKTSTSFAGQCITFQANLGDGVIHALNFQFTSSGR